MELSRAVICGYFFDFKINPILTITVPYNSLLYAAIVHASIFESFCSLKKNVHVHVCA